MKKVKSPKFGLISGLPGQKLTSAWVKKWILRLEAQTNLQHMLHKIPLTEDERAAVEEGIEFMEKLCGRLADVPTLAGPTPRELGTGGRRELPVLTAILKE